MNKIEKIRINKFLKEKEHIDRLISRGLHPIEIADRLIHNMLDLMREGYRNEFPNADDEEIFRKMQKQVNLYKKMKHKRRKKIDGRI